MTERDWADEVAQELEAYCFLSSMRNHSTDHIIAALRAAYNRGLERGCDLILESMETARRAVLIPEGK